MKKSHIEAIQKKLAEKNREHRKGFNFDKAIEYHSKKASAY